MEGYTRVYLKKVVSESGKAKFVRLEGKKKDFEIWIPNSCHTIHYGLGKYRDVIDIKNWFYDKDIEPKA